MKLVSIETIKTFQEKFNRKGKIIVFTNGCFDIVHAGHVNYLNSAKSYGDVLIIGLNNDNSVKKLKGETRPINNEYDRAEVLAGLYSVDFIIFFSEDNPLNLIKQIKPNIYVKGADYITKNFPEKKEVETYGGKIIFVPLLKGRSTTNIINKVKSSY